MSKKKDEDKDLTKTSVSGFRGGLRLDLEADMSSGKSLKEELSQYLKEVLDQEIRNQENYVSKIPDWQNLYRGKKERKTWPWDDCANTHPPITRSNVDTLFVRQMDNLFNKERVWLVTAKEDGLAPMAKQMEDALHWYQMNVLDFKSRVSPSLMQATKIGTGIVKFVYEEKKKTVYRYASQAEMDNPDIQTLAVEGAKSKVIASVKTMFRGPNVYPVSREDWVQSSDSLNIEECAVCGDRFYLRAPQIRIKVKQGLFSKEASEKLLTPSTGGVDAGSPDDFDRTKKERAEQERQEMKPVDRNKPFEFWDLWVKYDVNEDGEEEDINVVLHRQTGAIMDAIYHPLFNTFRPYIKFIFWPVEFSRDGEGICQILESLQSEINTLHNQRIDRITEINCPVYFVKAGSGLENLQRIEPGKVYTVEEDPSTAITEFKFSDTTISSFQEEDRLIGLADRACGISPVVQGQPTSERPVAKESWALIEETNKKFKYGIENVRKKFTDAGYKLLDFLAQYQPRLTYLTDEGQGVSSEKTIEFPTQSIRDLFKVELAASSDVTNVQMRRDANTVLYQMMSDYMTKLGSMGQMLTSNQVPSDFKKIILDVNDKSVKIMTRIIDDFPTVPDSKSVVTDLRQVLGGDLEKVIMNSPDLQPPPPPPGAPEGQGGPPPSPGAPGRPPGGGASPLPGQLATGPPGRLPPGPPMPAGPPGAVTPEDMGQRQ